MIELHYRKQIHHLYSIDELIIRFEVERPTDREIAFLRSQAEKGWAVYADLDPYAEQVDGVRRLVFATGQERLKERLYELIGKI